MVKERRVKGEMEWRQDEVREDRTERMEGEAEDEEGIRERWDVK